MRPANGRQAFRPGDAVAITAVVLTAVIMLVCFLSGAVTSRNTVARIYRNQELIREVRLDVDTEFLVEGQYRNHITVRDGKIAVTESDCPGTDCVHSGWIQTAGRSIVCLPNRMEIRLEGAEEADEVDAVVR